jgi:cytochrome c oxidase cbb3-type subunit 3
MPDMPTAFWSGWIIVLTIGSLGGLLWLIFSVYYSKKSAQDFNSPVWDENLREGNNPAPMWWFWMILTALVFSVIYLILYPGLGSFGGALKWSQSGRLDKNLILYAYEYSDQKENVLHMPLAELQQNNQLMDSANRLFSQNCAACHGMDAHGQAMAFPNLVDSEWQWGGAAEDIEHSIRHGRKAVMVGWQAVLGDEGVEQVIDYVKEMSAVNSQASGTKGQELYQQFCIGCHGMEGEGNPVLGAPSLADDVWLYGNSDEQLHHSISIGRNGHMPAFENRLSDMEIKLLVAWLSRQ